MRKLIIIGIGFAIVIVLSSLYFYRSGLPEVGDNFARIPKLESSQAVGEKWVSVFKKVPGYYQPPKPKTQNTSQPVVEVQKITDGSLIGIIKKSEPTALIVIPKQSDVTYFRVGDSWLSPWILEEIHNDSIVWVNSITNETTLQKLF